MTETTIAPETTKVMPVGDGDADLPHIIIVGGGAGGLELATRLGDKLGKDHWFSKKRAQLCGLLKSLRASFKATQLQSNQITRI